MSTPPNGPPYSPAMQAEARQIVTRFDSIQAEYGPQEAGELRAEAWTILLASHAARLTLRRSALLRQFDQSQPGHPSGDAA